MAARRLIAQRQRDEAQRASLAAKVQQEQTERRYADWENATHARVQQTQRLRAVDRGLQERQRAVEERRERLAALFISEQDQYFKELENMVETQDQRKQRLAARAMELKQQREERRKEFAQAKLDQAFRENCDELRCAISQVNLLQVVADREQQREWKALQQQEADEENRIFDELWEKERLKKVQRAQEDMERTRRMNCELREQLKAQVEAFAAVKKREAELQAEEDRILRHQAELEKQRETQRERDRVAQARALGQAAKQHNQAQWAKRREEEKVHRLQELQEIQAMLCKIKEEDDREARQKGERREEMVRYRATLQQHVREQAQAEVEMERLWQIETEKAWKKREACWQREEEARETLLCEVLEERAKQLAQKYATLKQQRHEQAAEKERLLEQMEAAAQLDVDQAKARREWMLQARAEIEQQIEEKRSFKERQKQESELEKASNAIMQEEYRKKVQNELDSIKAARPSRFRAQQASFTF